MELYQEFTFDAAHCFPNEEHDYQRALHGHSFTARVVVAGKVNAASGFLTDLGRLDQRCKEVRAELDHKLLNDIPGLGCPSLEHLALWIWRRLKPTLPGLARVEVSRESQRHGCIYTGE